jgi:hypothetical protein
VRAVTSTCPSATRKTSVNRSQLAPDGSPTQVRRCGGPPVGDRGVLHVPHERHVVHLALPVDVVLTDCYRNGEDLRVGHHAPSFYCLPLT